MASIFDTSRSFSFRAGLGFAAVLFLSACAHPDGPDAINDPNEARNRQVHEFNANVDRTIVRPLADTYAAIVPEAGSTAINNFAFNFSEPRNVVNRVLQGELDKALVSGARFVFNTTIGLLGFVDVAGFAGVEGESTDFGETLHTWGVGEGRYVELPLVGPSTARHTVGRVADLVTNPLTFLLPEPEAYYGTASSFAWALDTRGDLGDTLDDILDNSADSYAQARILYLQNRRFKLSDGLTEDDVTDPFAELGLE